MGAICLLGPTGSAFTEKKTDVVSGLDTRKNQISSGGLNLKENHSRKKQLLSKERNCDRPYAAIRSEKRPSQFRRSFISGKEKHFLGPRERDSARYGGIRKKRFKTFSTCEKRLKTKIRRPLGSKEKKEGKRSSGFGEECLKVNK